MYTCHVQVAINLKSTKVYLHVQISPFIQVKETCPNSRTTLKKLIQISKFICFDFKFGQVVQIHVTNIYIWQIPYGFHQLNSSLTEILHSRIPNLRKIPLNWLHCPRCCNRSFFVMTQMLSSISRQLWDHIMTTCTRGIINNNPQYGDEPSWLRMGHPTNDDLLTKWARKQSLNV